MATTRKKPLLSEHQKRIRKSHDDVAKVHRDLVQVDDLGDSALAELIGIAEHALQRARRRADALLMAGKEG